MGDSNRKRPEIDVSRRWKWCCICLIGVAVIVGVAWLNWSSWRGHDSEGAAVRNLVLTLASVVALVLAVWRSEVAQQQLDHHQRSLLNDRYQRAADMLGNEAMAVRLGGIDALERLDRELPNDYHIQVMQLFAAVLRKPPHEKTDGSRGDDDLRAICEYLRGRSEDGIEIERADKYRINLRGAYLRGFSLRDADLTGAILWGADLERADLRKTNLNRADLENARLTNADLRDAIGLTQNQLDQAARTPGGPQLDDPGPLVWKEMDPPKRRKIVLE